MDNVIATNNKSCFLEAVCEIIREEANRNIGNKGSFTFVLSGGRTPKDIFKILSKRYVNSINWSKVHFFWVDERCTIPTSDDSNYKLANVFLLSKLRDIGSVHRIIGELEPEIAASKYELEIQKFFGSGEIQFDFFLLGMGEDGHVGSVFPESTELLKNTNLVLATDKMYNGHIRVTLGLDTINKGCYKLLMVNSKTKMDIIYTNDLRYPINRIKNKTISYLRSEHP